LKNSTPHPWPLPIETVSQLTRDDFCCKAEQAVGRRSFRAETFYRPATGLQTHEKIAFARRLITINLNDRILKLRRLTFCSARINPPP
jgi:hypothetical protein